MFGCRWVKGLREPLEQRKEHVPGSWDKKNHGVFKEQGDRNPDAWWRWVVDDMKWVWRKQEQTPWKILAWGETVLPTWLPREVICPETVPGVFQQLHRVLRKMSLSLALQTESTALIRPREQSDAFLSGRKQDRKWQWELAGQRKPAVMIKRGSLWWSNETMPGGYCLYSCTYLVLFIEPL